MVNYGDFRLILILTHWTKFKIRNRGSCTVVRVLTSGKLWDEMVTQYQQCYDDTNSTSIKMVC